MTVSSWTTRTVAVCALLSGSVAGGVLVGQEPVLRLRASAAGSPVTLTIELLRWSSDAEREMVTSALDAPVAAPPAPPAAPPPPAGGRGRAGRGAAPPPSPMAKLSAAIKAAPTVGYIWGEGPTGYSIKYAWRAAPAQGQSADASAASRTEGPERIVFVTDRRVGPHILPTPAASAGSADVEFTVIEARTDGKGAAQLEVTR